MITFKEFLKKYGITYDIETIDEIIISHDGTNAELFEGRKWISGRFERNIGIDQPNHGVGQTHAHVFGRKDNELGVVNFDGTSSHGTKMKLHQKDADALRARGFTIKSDGIVEWVVIRDYPNFLLHS